MLALLLIRFFSFIIFAPEYQIVAGPYQYLAPQILSADIPQFIKSQAEKLKWNMICKERKIINGSRIKYVQAYWKSRALQDSSPSKLKGERIGKSSFGMLKPYEYIIYVWNLRYNSMLAPCGQLLPNDQTSGQFDTYRKRERKEKRRKNSEVNSNLWWVQENFIHGKILCYKGRIWIFNNVKQENGGTCKWNEIISFRILET